jgi:hypothetical protein
MQSGCLKRIAAALLGLLLIAYGLRGIALTVLGATTQAEVTEIRRAIDQQDGVLDHSYDIHYRFHRQDQVHHGSYRMRHVYDVTALPRVGERQAVRYVPGLPSLNGVPGDGIVGGLLVGAVGVVILVSQLRPKRH